MELQNLNLPVFEVGQFVEVFNQTIDQAYPLIQVVGEVASFKFNQDKYIFFDLKDNQATINCFMMKFKLNCQVEDGMKVMIMGRPNLTKWGKFSITVNQIKPFGEGSLKKSRQLLIRKLTKEGLFEETHKQLLPSFPERIGVITSVESAGFADFKRIITDNWPVAQIIVKNTTVQGEIAPEQIVSAIEQFNDIAEKPDLLLILRGGGSKDDLSCFDDERIARAIFASKLPIATGIGHQIDISVADLVADKYFATPTHLAQSVVPNRGELLEKIKSENDDLLAKIDDNILDLENQNQQSLELILERLKQRITDEDLNLKTKVDLIEAYNPRAILSRGYAILRGQVKQEQILEIETDKNILKAQIKEIYDKK